MLHSGMEFAQCGIGGILYMSPAWNMDGIWDVHGVKYRVVGFS